jgi:hypothetical protein
MKYPSSSVNNPAEYLTKSKPPPSLKSSRQQERNSHVTKSHRNPHRQPPPPTHARIIKVFSRLFCGIAETELTIQRDCDEPMFR